MTKSKSASAHKFPTINGLTPVKKSDVCFVGVVYTFVETEEDIRKSGLVPEEFAYPSAGKGSCINRTQPDYIKLSRLGDGRLSLSIGADRVMTVDKSFRNFFGGLLVDTRLSLVKGETA